jgi:DNA-directed RNA polymerase omega subunit
MRRPGGLRATMSKNALLGMALRKVLNRFLLVNLLNRRIRQLKDGARPLIQEGNTLSVDEIALQEIAEGKITPTSFSNV